MPNNYDNKNIRFTGDPVAFDGVEGKRDPKTGKGRFDLIPTEVFYPLFSKADHDWLLDCHPASILMSIADEKFIDAIHKSGIAKGRIQGKAEGKTEILIAESVVAGIGLIAYAGYKAYETIKDRHEREELETKEKEAEKAKKELIKGMKEAISEECSSKQQNEAESEEEMKNTQIDDNLE